MPRFIIVVTRLLGKKFMVQCSTMPMFCNQNGQSIIKWKQIYIFRLVLRSYYKQVAIFFKMKISLLHSTQCYHKRNWKHIRSLSFDITQNEYECESFIALLLFYGCQCLRACESCAGSILVTEVTIESRA